MFTIQVPRASPKSPKLWYKQTAVAAGVNFFTPFVFELQVVIGKGVAGG
jgi:hypothetical protein